MNTIEYTPFRFREVAGKLLVTNEAGDYGVFDPDVVERFFDDRLTSAEHDRFRDLSIVLEPDGQWRVASLMRRVRAAAANAPAQMSYLIIVPTLRCNLSCSYCQVSRAPIDAKGFDWGPDELKDFEAFINGMPGDTIKLEFQGGEPTLRTDLLNKIIEICERRFSHREFVVCTNLTNLSPEVEALYARDDVVVSTSIDGPPSVMTKNRTGDDVITQTIFKNLHQLMKTYGPDKVSALPTITEATIEQPESVIDMYRSLGFQSIFLRPVNYMGFARKKHREIVKDFDQWRAFYVRALDHIININDSGYFEEFYVSMLVRSIFANVKHGFVDFRSPSRFLQDYGVIDFDGKVYPSDEARMLSRIGHVDLSVGHMKTGIESSKVAELNFNAVNQVNPDCIHCAYMPMCGIDVIDDMSRYGRIDLPKFDTWFCHRHMMLFDLIFSKVIERDRRWLDVFLTWIFRKSDGVRGYEVFGD